MFLKVSRASLESLWRVIIFMDEGRMMALCNMEHCKWNHPLFTGITEFNVHRRKIRKKVGKKVTLFGRDCLTYTS